MRKINLRLLSILRFFGLIFLVYCLAFFGLLLIFRPMDYSGGYFQAVPEPVSVIAVMASFSALVASVFSLIGFLSSTILAWRKEKRDVLSYEVDLEKKELEIVKLKVELDRLTGGNRNEVSLRATNSSSEGYVVPGTHLSDQIGESDKTWRPTPTAQADA